MIMLQCTGMRALGDLAFVLVNAWSFSNRPRRDLVDHTEHLEILYRSKVSKSLCRARLILIHQVAYSALTRLIRFPMSQCAATPS